MIIPILSWVITCLSLISSAIAWYNTDSVYFLSSVAVSIGSFTIVNIYELWNDIFLNRHYKHMPRNKQCCVSFFDWSTSDSVLWLTCAFRTLAGVFAIVACYVSWSNRVRFWNDGHYLPISIAWSVAVCLWLVSTIPHMICLIQCAAGLNYKLFTFRKRVTVWLLHDVVLGIFWLYLSSMLYDLSDDKDDSEWRTVFLSMLSWHIVVVILQQSYFTDNWSVSLNVSCCAPEMSNRWCIISMLSSLVVVYAIVMSMLKVKTGTNIVGNGTIHMECTLTQLILFITAISIGCVSKLKLHHWKNKVLTSKSNTRDIMPEHVINHLNF